VLSAADCIAIKEANQLIQSKQDLYQALREQQYYLPHIQFCSKGYLVNVRARSTHCFKSHQITVRNCVRPPLRDFLVKTVLALASQQGHRLGFQATAAKLPERDWMLAMIATYEPDHAIF
jgi:hypothetical protein